MTRRGYGRWERGGVQAGEPRAGALVSSPRPPCPLEGGEPVVRTRRNMKPLASYLPALPNRELLARHCNARNGADWGCSATSLAPRENENSLPVVYCQHDGFVSPRCRWGPPRGFPHLAAHGHS